MTNPEFVLAFLAVAAVLAVASMYLYRRFGITGRVVASDSGVSRATPVLRSERYGLSGRPDYLIEERGRVVPVEVKPRRRSATPWPRDVLQLAAYCLLVEDQLGEPVPYGVVRYRDGEVRVDYTPELREALLELLDEMREARETDEVHRSHEEPPRCAACSYRDACDESLA